MLEKNGRLSSSRQSPLILGVEVQSVRVVSGMSDFLWLSDNCRSVRAPLVRFFMIIGQLPQCACVACPILPGYRTTTVMCVLRLSDSSGLSDNHRHVRAPLVRFFRVIGQAPFLVNFAINYNNKITNVDIMLIKF